MRQKAIRVLEELRGGASVSYPENVHAIHPDTGETLCSHGRRIMVFGFHERAVFEDITCEYCIIALNLIRRIAEGE